MEPKSIKDICSTLKIPPASTYRIMRCLIGYGYLRESRTYPDKYTLGYKINVLARNSFSGFDLCEIAHPYMATLATETGQACQLCVLGDNAAITIDQALPTSAITVIAKLGSKVPINVSACGRLLVALLPAEKQSSFLTNAWKIIEKNNEHTIDDISQFAALLPGIREQLYGTDMEEYAIGIGCLAVPIFDTHEKPIAAIGLTGQIDNYRDEVRFQKSLSSLRHASLLISQEISLVSE